MKMKKTMDLKQDTSKTKLKGKKNNLTLAETPTRTASGYHQPPSPADATAKDQQQVSVQKQ
jgi:hypothetical protein